MTQDQDPPSVEELVQKLKKRVEERRSRGEYPPELEENLEAHFQRIVANRSKGSATIQELLAEVFASLGFDASAINLESRLPAGKMVHRLVSRLVTRQTQGIIEQTSRFGHTVYEALKATEALYPALVEQIDAINERLAVYERTPEDSGLALRDLRRRVEELESAELRRRFRPTYKNERFEEEFRGSRDELLDRYRDLAQKLVGCSPVLDVGCGRGEFLELLQGSGVEAIGVEIDEELVQTARQRGLKVAHSNGITYLASQVDGSLGGIVLIQVVEHLAAQEVIDLVAIAYDKLRPGGMILMETINPQSLYVFAHSYYIDPTHLNPVHPVYLTFLLKEAGFNDIEIDWRSPPPKQDILVEFSEDGHAGALNLNIKKLNQLLFAPQDYALIATR